MSSWCLLVLLLLNMNGTVGWKFYPTPWSGLVFLLIRHDIDPNALAWRYEPEYKLRKEGFSTSYSSAWRDVVLLSSHRNLGPDADFYPQPLDNFPEAGAKSMPSSFGTLKYDMLYAVTNKSLSKIIPGDLIPIGEVIWSAVGISLSEEIAKQLRNKCQPEIIWGCWVLKLLM